jgi:hypothetical protein
MKTIEELAREAGMLRPCGDHSVCGNCEIYAWGDLDQGPLTRFRDLVLEEAAKVCDTTPPYPFRPSIEAAHAIRALKDKQ